MCLMNWMVFVPVLPRFRPWARRPNLLAAERCPVALVLGSVMSSRNSRFLPVSVSMTAFAKGVELKSVGGGARNMSARVDCSVACEGLLVAFKAFCCCGKCVGPATLGHAAEKISASLPRAASFWFPIWNGGALGCGFNSAAIRLVAAICAALAEGNLGIEKVDEKKSMVSPLCSESLIGT
jgi:hypothetical protein